VIVTIFGTSAELIKLAPVLRRLQDRGNRPLVACAGQHPEQIPQLMRDFGLGSVDVWLSRGADGADLRSVGQYPRWAADLALGFARERRTLRAALDRGTNPLVIVHSDTLTTVLGAAMGRALGATVAHVESGYRTGDLRNPFPEELDRRTAERLAHMLFPPGQQQRSNISRSDGDVVDTHENTVLDSLAMVPPGEVPFDVPTEPFGVVVLHRFELLSDEELFRSTIETLARSTDRHPLLLLAHGVTGETIDRLGLGTLFGERFRRIPRLAYFPFVSLLKQSAFIVTDSGGCQQECTYLGHPCCVHRAATETAVGPSVYLTGFDLDRLREFLADPAVYAVGAPALDASPSDIIVNHLEERGFLSTEGSPT
jgi:UDP-N-acetylglucosamine 2-epimerase (non-hydrolysing)